jgi:catechol 2,3-dioxygenase
MILTNIKKQNTLSRFKINDIIRLSCVALTVKDIDKTLAFYEKKLGLQTKKRDQDDDGNLVCELGFRHTVQNVEPFLQLHHDPNAKTASPHSSGLFHFAMLIPNGKGLASTYLALKNSGVHYDGFADHLVSESLYFRDPENNGIEVYRDRARQDWPRDPEGRILMDTLPLNLESIVSEMGETKSENAIPFPNGARIGHMHLKVTNLMRSMKFYHEKLALDITVDWSSMGAAFLSVGGYHHHIGMNTWHSLNGQSQNSNVAGLKNFTIVIPDVSFFNKIRSTIENDYFSCKQLQQQESVYGNQFTLSDPNGIQIVIKS